MTGSGLAIDAAVIALLAWVAREDSLRFRIPNRAVGTLVLAFPAGCLLQGRSELLLPHGLFALAALIVLFGAFAAGICGGGDAKLLASALLWIGPDGVLVFAVLLLAAVTVYAAGAALGWLPARRTDGRLRIPLGPCIAFAWTGVIVLVRLVA